MSSTFSKELLSTAIDSFMVVYAGNYKVIQTCIEQLPMMIKRGLGCEMFSLEIFCSIILCFLNESTTYWNPLHCRMKFSKRPKLAN